MNNFSMHNVISVAFEPVEHISGVIDSYYVRMIVTQQSPYSEDSTRTEVILHSDKPLLLGIPD